jgi:group I intron endonuclease
MVVYKTINLINGKIYIGRDKHDNPNYYGSGVLLAKAIQKYGKENFIKEILEDGIETIKELNEREIYWISCYNSQDQFIGYNLQKGGQGGDWESLTLEQQDHIKNRVKESSTGRIKSSLTIEKMRSSMKGKNTGIKTEKTRNLMSVNRKGKGLGNKPWNAGKTNVYSNETLELLSKASQGKNNSMFGKHHTEESKDKIRKKAQGRIPPNKGKFKIFVFIKDDTEIASIIGQHNAILYCKENNLPYSVLVKKLLPWNEYKCITKIN